MSYIPAVSRGNGSVKKKHRKLGFDRPCLCWRPAHHRLRGLAVSVSWWYRGQQIRIRSSAVAEPRNVGMGKSLWAPFGTRSAKTRRARARRTASALRRPGGNSSATDRNGTAALPEDLMTYDTHQKVSSSHLKRDAYLYVRQSTLRQVFENQESTRRQYALKQQGVALGWAPDRIVVIDSDLGESRWWRQTVKVLLSASGNRSASVL